ncbi:MAG: tRNA preQ1(34) S-adenosylmethionine ribosyltransferase-isomerase QueA, partial [Chloroflexota bacterium]|nr:tRNA preQ1(34) S-adenosylmethionine ribosyltransferase-isomerase QueA [Chloroflexota bacterium]
LVLNDTRVVHARLLGHKITGAKIELLLLHNIGEKVWRSLVKGSGIKSGTVIEFDEFELKCQIVRRDENGSCVVKFSHEVEPVLNEIGQIPLPPYIKETLGDSERYQTVYAVENGSVAAPTAGLHFTRELLESITRIGVRVVTVTLHVGLDTFMPVRVEHIDMHNIHSEWCRIDGEVINTINSARVAGGRIVAVGTTTVRVLETASVNSASGHMESFDGYTDLFIYPGYSFSVVDSLLTNFHLPKSTLLMMMGAFMAEQGIQTLLDIYADAIQEGYRFYSFGDAMLVL